MLCVTTVGKLLIRFSMGELDIHLLTEMVKKEHHTKELSSVPTTINIWKPPKRFNKINGQHLNVRIDIAVGNP